ncbi:translation elongation factor Ts [Woeseiaceae bacterium]|nr:translation elongation factor Ts [Woeseiaceae bacterium]
MSISASIVKELRDHTGAGMMECKKALVETGGDMERAIEILRKLGQAKADKKSGRIAAEGCIILAAEGNRGVIAEINSETDFAAKDQNFIAFAKSVAATALAGDAKKVEALMVALNIDGKMIEAARTELISKIGENISVRRFARVDAADQLGSYAHRGRIGAIVSLSGGDAELARNIAMHVVASNPMCIDESGMPVEVLASERRILTEQAAESGKPPDIIQKMINGRLSKFLKEKTLLGQPFIKDPDVSVGKLLKVAGAQVEQFVRYELGEGIKKK